MKKLVKLDARLSACSDMVRQKSKIVDVGTDHAYLPIFLVQREKINHAIASDIAEGPLASAQKNIVSYGVQDKIETRKSNGLEGILPQEADDIIIAGMGGELIADILSNCSWIKDKEKRLILQPMSSFEDLRRYLHKNKFSVLNEKAVKIDFRVYTIMNVVYIDETENLDEIFYYIGKLDLKIPESREYAEKQLVRLKNQQKGKLCMNQDDANEKRIVEKIEKLLAELGKNYD